MTRTIIATLAITIVTTISLEPFNLSSMASSLGLMSQADAKKALIDAVASGNRERALALLKAGVSPCGLQASVVGLACPAPLLTCAIIQGSYILTTALIQYGANIHEADREGYTPIDWATRLLMEGTSLGKKSFEVRKAIFDTLWNQHARYGSTTLQLAGKTIATIV